MLQSRSCDIIGCPVGVGDSVDAVVEQITQILPGMSSKRELVGCKDPSSFANIDECRASSCHLDIRVDFDRKVLEGQVALTFKNVAPLTKGIVVSIFFLSTRIYTVKTLKSQLYLCTVRRVLRRQMAVESLIVVLGAGHEWWPHS